MGETRLILPPCQRDGAPGDWWGKQHEHCTGSQHVRCVAEPIVCECECHRAVTATASLDGTKLALLPHDMRAAILGESAPAFVVLGPTSSLPPDPRDAELARLRERVRTLEARLAVYQRDYGDIDL